MYPQPELNRLAARKELLRRNIAVHRALCMEAAARVAQPLEWADRVLAFWRRLSPLATLASVPVALLIQRSFLRRPRFLDTCVRWSPLLFGAIRFVGRTVQTCARPSKSSNGDTLRVEVNL